MSSAIEIIPFNDVRILLRERVEAGGMRLYAHASLTRQTMPLEKILCLPGRMRMRDYEHAVDAVEECEIRYNVVPHLRHAAIASEDKAWPVILPPVVELLHGEFVLMFGYPVVFAMRERGEIKHGVIEAILVRHVVGNPVTTHVVPEPMPESVRAYTMLQETPRERGYERLLTNPY